MVEGRLLNEGVRKKDNAPFHQNSLISIPQKAYTTRTGGIKCDVRGCRPHDTGAVSHLHPDVRAPGVKGEERGGALPSQMAPPPLLHLTRGEKSGEKKRRPHPLLGEEKPAQVHPLSPLSFKGGSMRISSPPQMYRSVFSLRYLLNFLYTEQFSREEGRGKCRWAGGQDDDGRRESKYSPHSKTAHLSLL